MDEQSTDDLYPDEQRMSSDLWGKEPVEEKMLEEAVPFALSHSAVLFLLDEHAMCVCVRQLCLKGE